MISEKAYIITTEDHVVKYITTKLTVEESIIRLNGFNIVNDGVVIHELDYLPVNLKVEEDCYNGTAIFKNPNFNSGVEVSQLKTDLDIANRKITEQQDIIDTLVITMLGGM